MKFAFRSKQDGSIVQAARVETDGALSYPPESWAKRAIERGRIRGPQSRTWTVDTPDGEHQAKPTDWIAKHSNGDLAVYTSDEFQRLHDPYEGAA